MADGNDPARRPQAVKLGASRQVVIPKRIYDALHLAPGDYLEAALEDGRVVFTPKTLVDRDPHPPDA